MAKNHIQPGDVLDHTAAAALITGQAFLLGVRLAVALKNAAIGDTVPVAVKGVYNLPKVTADDASQGEPLYWDNTAKKLTTTSTSNTLAGYAADPAGAGATTVNVHLNA